MSNEYSNTERFKVMIPRTLYQYLQYSTLYNTRGTMATVHYCQTAVAGRGSVCLMKGVTYVKHQWIEDGWSEKSVGMIYDNKSS